jgi:hypothetical protein
MRVAEDEEKGTSSWGYNWTTPSLGGHKYRDLVLQVGGWMQDVEIEWSNSRSNIVYVKNVVFWDVAPCSSCVNRRFGTYRHLQGRKSASEGPE